MHDAPGQLSMFRAQNGKRIVGGFPGMNNQRFARGDSGLDVTPKAFSLPC